MDLSNVLNALREKVGNRFGLDTSKAEKKETDVFHSHKPLFSYMDKSYRVINMNAIEEFFEKNMRKTRSYTKPKQYGGGVDRWVVYSVNRTHTPYATHTVQQNQRTLYHGTSLSTLFAIMADNGRLRHTAVTGSLLGVEGVYVGPHSKAMTYVKDEKQIYRLDKTPLAKGITEPPLLPGQPVEEIVHCDTFKLVKGIMLKVRVELGRVHVAKSGGEKYQDVRQKRDSLAAFRGSSLGGSVWGGALRNSEWVVRDHQIVLEEVHIRLDDEAIKNLRQVATHKRAVDAQKRSLEKNFDKIGGKERPATLSELLARARNNFGNIKVGDRVTFVSPTPKGSVTMKRRKRGP